MPGRKGRHDKIERSVCKPFSTTPAHKNNFVLAVEQTERNCVFREMAKQIFMILVSGEIFYCLAGYYAILEHPEPQGGVA